MLNLIIILAPLTTCLLLPAAERQWGEGTLGHLSQHIMCFWIHCCFFSIQRLMAPCQSCLWMDQALTQKLSIVLFIFSYYPQLHPLLSGLGCSLGLGIITDFYNPFDSGSQSPDSIQFSLRQSEIL